MDEATKDTLSRACIKIGTDLPRDATTARDVIASIQQRVDVVSPTDTVQLAALAKELDAWQRTPDQDDVYSPTTTVSENKAYRQN